MTADKLLDAGEVAELLNVPKSWVREQTRRGLMPHVSLGRYRRYQHSSVLEWIAGHEVASTHRR
jgi:excisionase family DNA binding protein